MKTLISTAEAVEAGFADAEYMPPEAIAQSDIAAAERRYLLPVIGHALYGRMIEGGYAALKEEYVAPALAACVRVMVQPLLAARCGACGVVAPAGDGMQSVDEVQRAELMKALRRRAREMVARMSDYLESHAAEYAEYDPEKNILNRCTIYGDIVAIR